jgi:hypothetical protein
MQKNQNDRFRRLKLYECAIDLIQNSRIVPVSKKSKEKPLEILHRLYGINANNQFFIVQIKESIKTGEKFFISVFPED